MSIKKEVDLDFKSQFYNLQGTHIDERKRNFYKLLKSTSPDISPDQIDIQPRNYQERIFYVDVLIHFKKVEKLIEILKEGIGVLSSKILKQKWFFQEAFKDMSEDEIVNKFLPNLSYSLKMKVLKKLSLTLSEERMGKIFDLVLERYGLFVAKQFLFSCSSEKIVHVLRTNEITLLSEQLKRLLQKDVDLLKVYFEEYKKNNRKEFDDWAFLTYLTWKHPNLYFDWELNAKPRIKLGRYTTRTLLKTNKADVIKDIQNSGWNKAAIVRELKEFDTKYFFTIFPVDMQALDDYAYSSSLESFLSKYPTKKRWEVLSQAFKQAYNDDIIKYLDNFDETVAKFFPDEIKQLWAENKYRDSDNLVFIKYFNPKKAFSLLKDKINVTSDINQRGTLINELITVCYKHKDYSTYEEVLEYICMRHRNVDKRAYANMISHIRRNIDYDLISENHWKYINEIIDIQRVKGESFSIELVAEYLLFVYKEKLPLDGPVTAWIKDCLKIDLSFRLRRSFKESVAAEKTILKYILKILPTLELENKRKFIQRIVNDAVDFNKDIKNDKILSKEFDKFWIDLNEWPVVIDSVKDFFTKEEPYSMDDSSFVNNLLLYNYLYSEYPLKVIDENRLLDVIKAMFQNEDTLQIAYGVLEVIKKPDRNNFQSNLLDYFFSHDSDMYFLNYLRFSATEHFMAKEPAVVAKYLSVILSFDVKGDIYCHLNYDLKRYSHLGLAEKLIAHVKNLVSVDSNCKNKTYILKTLSRIIDVNDYLDLVKDYIPDTKKLRLNNKEQRKVYLVQCHVAKTFKNFDEPTLLAPVLMNFCQGGYLQFSLPALYKMLYRLNEENVSFYINILKERAVSTKKHAIFLGFKLLAFKNATNLYSLLSSKETNTSAKKYLFGAVLKYFLQNPSALLLEVVFKDMVFIDKDDTEMIQTLVESISKLPNKDAPLFFEKIWNFLDVLDQQEVKVVDYRYKLLNIVSDDKFEMSFFLKLNKNFFENIINIYFLSSDKKFQKFSSSLNYFVINYLLAYLDEPHFNFVFNIIKRFKDIHWMFNNTDNIKRIFNFFTSVYEKFNESDVKFLQLFSSFWQRVFSHEESFSEHILLRLMVLYKENTNIETFSKKVDKFFEELIGEYGPSIMYNEFLIGSIKQFFHNIHTKNSTDFDLINFAFYLLESSSSEFNCYVSFQIIRNFNGTDQKKMYLKVLGALQTVNILSVRVYCNVLLKKNELF